MGIRKKTIPIHITSNLHAAHTQKETENSYFNKPHITEFDSQVHAMSFSYI